MKGQKGTLVNAATVVLALTVSLAGCSENTDKVPSKEGEELLLEGLKDTSGIFDMEVEDSVKEELPEETGIGQPNLKEEKADPSENADPAGRDGGKTGSAGEPAKESTLPKITQVPEKELLTTEFSTWYGDSQPARCSNIERAAQLLNGCVIAPGETFSCRETISPLTEENGYQPAGTYVEGKVEQSIGGGVCQVSSTLYNAALLAGLTIAERAAHSMAVGYVEPARDAAIAGDYKDLKLRNDFEYPVMIEAQATDGSLRFVVHTAQEDTGAVVELQTVILSQTEPGETVVTVDENLPEDYYKVTQKAHIGYEAELYRIVWRDGVEVLREWINTSSYAPAPEYVTIGGKEQTE